MMKTSFSTLACPDWGLERILDAGRTYGYDGVELRVVSRELDLWKLSEFQKASLPETRRRIEDHGLQIVCIGSGACFHSPVKRERQLNIESVLRMAEIAAGLRSPSVRVFPDRIQSGCDRAQTMRWIAECLVDSAGKLEGSGVQVWLETHGDFAGLADVTEVLRLVIRSDVGLVWDPANAFSRSREMPFLSQEMTAHLRHVHAKDLQLNGVASASYVLTGEGDFPFDPMFQALKEAGYEGFVSFEWEKQWHPELPPPEVALPYFVNWWKARQAARC